MSKSVPEQVLDVMRSDAPNHLFRKMERDISLLDSSDYEVRLNAANEIKGMCNVKALGDLHVSSLNWKEWLKLLEKLKKYANAKIAK